MAAAKIDEDRRKQIEAACVAEAWRTGATSAITALGVAGAAVGGANYFLQGFRTSLGVSGKAALVVRPDTDFQLALCACQTLCSTKCARISRHSCRCLQHLQCFGSTQSWPCMSAPRRSNLSYLSSLGKASHQHEVAYALGSVLASGNASTCFSQICAIEETATCTARCQDMLCSVALC